MYISIKSIIYGIAQLSGNHSGKPKHENHLHLGTTQDSWKVDLYKFRIYLKDKYKVTDAFLFIGYIEKNQKNFQEIKIFEFGKKRKLELLKKLSWLRRRKK